MTLTDYVLQVLVEESPYVYCTDIQDRPIVYEDAAINITNDIIEDPTVDINKVVRYWIFNEFGKEVYEESTKRIVIRIMSMVKQDDLKIGF